MTVRYTNNERSNPTFLLEVDGAPDTTSPGESGDLIVRPANVTVVCWPGADGVLRVSSVLVGGRKVRDGKVTTTRYYQVSFSDPLGGGGDAPDWVVDLAVDYNDLLNPTVAPAENDTDLPSMTAEEHLQEGQRLLAVSRCVPANPGVPLLFAEAAAHFQAVVAINSFGPDGPDAIRKE